MKWMDYEEYKEPLRGRALSNFGTEFRTEITISKLILKSLSRLSQ